MLYQKYPFVSNIPKYSSFSPSTRPTTLSSSSFLINFTTHPPLIFMFIFLPPHPHKPTTSSMATVMNRLSGGRLGSPEVKRIRDGILDESKICTSQDLDSFMKSFEEEIIIKFRRVSSQPNLGYHFDGYNTHHDHHHVI